MTRCLFCVLDWGLGHASRSVPIIQELINKGVHIHIASNGRAGLLLQKELPNLKYHELPDYGVSYPFQDIRVNMLLQWPKILRAIIKEHRVVKAWCKEHKFDLVISDNRYGCYAKSTKSVLITHQINPAASDRFSSWFASKLSRWFLNNFSHVWIPDELSNGLCGDMTARSPDHGRHIGFLSRFSSAKKSDTENELLVILSGPEPQRSTFEKELIVQLKAWGKSAKLVRGKTEGDQTWNQENDQIMIVDHLYGEDLSQEIRKSEVVLCRSGYSSLMDLIYLGKRSVVVPTPGQFEQEILLDNITTDHPFIGVQQKDLDLPEIMKVISTKVVKPNPYINVLLPVAIDDLLASIK